MISMIRAVQAIHARPQALIESFYGRRKTAQRRQAGWRRWVIRAYGG